MAPAGVSARPARRYAAPWWEELDREAFREFPAARRMTAPTRAAAPTARPASAPVRAGSPPTRAGSTVARAGSTPGQATNGRRTVTIRGYGAERNLPVARPTLRRHERPGFRPDRMALWAVVLGLVLILVAATSAHAAVAYQLAANLAR
jgi:hypothetical protein